MRKLWSMTSSSSVRVCSPSIWIFLKTSQTNSDRLVLDQLNPISAAYARYSPQATFHDPVSIAEGLESIVSSTFLYTTSRLGIQANSPLDQSIESSIQWWDFDGFTTKDYRRMRTDRPDSLGMPKIFSASTTEALKVLDNPEVVSSWSSA